MSRPMASIFSRSGPATLMPTGVLMPVASMSMRVLMGMIQALVRPGNWTVASSSSISPSTVMPGRHWSRGLSWIMVSIMVSGAGSVAVSARPILPNTRSTSGSCLIRRSVCCNSACALPMESPGSVVGMYIRSPSNSSGMNSEPSPWPNRASPGMPAKPCCQPSASCSCQRSTRFTAGPPSRGAAVRSSSNGHRTGSSTPPMP